MKSDPQATIRDAIRRRRKMLGMTQTAMAEHLGMHRAAYVRIEGGAQPKILTPTIRDRLDQALGELEAEMRRQAGKNAGPA